MSKNWYPVIDYDKCIGCMVCNNMCKHGVYKPDVVIFMGCNVSCPNVPSQYAENWGLDDPSGKSDDVFVETIRKIEKNVVRLREKLR